VGAENLCHEAILVNQAAGAVTSLNPDPVKVGDVVGQPAQRRGLLQGSGGPVGVVEVFVLPQRGHKVALVPYQGPVGQFAAQLPIHRSMTEFIRGAWMAERTILVPAARKTSSNAVVKLASRS
jgi:hypothetical protein